MVSFGLVVKKPEAIQKILKIRENLQIDNIVQNPFNGKIIAHKKDFFVVVMEPVYPRVYLLSFVPFFFTVFFWGSWFGWLAYTISMAMVLTRIFWWNRFYFLLFWIVTKRGVSFVSAEETIARIV